MPRTGPRRAPVTFKLTQEAIALIDARALDEGLTIRGGQPNRSAMIRRLIAYATAHMPKSWKEES